MVGEGQIQRVLTYSISCTTRANVTFTPTRSNQSSGLVVLNFVEINKTHAEISGISHLLEEKQNPKKPRMEMVPQFFGLYSNRNQVIPGSPPCPRGPGPSPRHHTMGRQNERNHRLSRDSLAGQEPEGIHEGRRGWEPGAQSRGGGWGWLAARGQDVCVCLSDR